MKCPFCGNLETQVVETRISEEADFIRRRRQCGACDKRFTTYERPDVSFPALVKKDGRRVEYKRSKLLDSMRLALRKRPVSTEQVDSAIERIEEKLLNLGLRPPRAPSQRLCWVLVSGCCSWAPAWVKCSLPSWPGCCQHLRAWWWGPSHHRPSATPGSHTD